MREYAILWYYGGRAENLPASIVLLLSRHFFRPVFWIRLQRVQTLNLSLNLVDTVAPCLVLSVQFNRVIRIGLARLLVLRVLLCLVIVAVKLRL